MASLLGDDWDDPRTMATLAAAGALMQGGRQGGLLGAVQAYTGLLGQSEERKAKKLYLDSQIAENNAQAEAKRAAIAQGQREEAAIRQAFSGLLGNGQPGANGVVTAPQAFNAAPLIAARMNPKLIEEYANLANLGRQEVARTVKSVGPDGREYETQYDKFGQKVGDALAQYRAPIMVNQGDRNTALDAYTLKPLASLAINQSADSKASNALGWANNALSAQRLALDTSTARAEGSTKGAPSGWRWTGNGGLEKIPGGPADQDKPTEDQSKARGWLTQAQAAQANMKRAIADDPGAATPGIGDAVGRLPGLGMIGNALTGDARQRFNQGASSFSEAVLRAATGAGVNESEARQKVAELTPQPFDSPKLRDQKLAAQDTYLKSLEIRANQKSGPQTVAPSGFKILKVE